MDGCILCVPLLSCLHPGAHHPPLFSRLPVSGAIQPRRAACPIQRPVLVAERKREMGRGIIRGRWLGRVPAHEAVRGQLGDSSLG